MTGRRQNNNTTTTTTRISRHLAGRTHKAMYEAVWAEEFVKKLDEAKLLRTDQVQNRLSAQEVAPNATECPLGVEESLNRTLLPISLAAASTFAQGDAPCPSRALQALPAQACRLGTTYISTPRAPALHATASLPGAVF